jgi:cytochrome P450
MACSRHLVSAVACPSASNDHFPLIPLRTSIGGAATTSSTMAWWPLAMLVYPETQARAHEELDAVVGRARLPTFADYPHLPYIRAMVKEVLRWRPTGPLGVPHRSTEDDWYEGMFIPKGTICIPNMWHMNRDPEVYGENAADFDPARHLDASGKFTSGESGAKDDGHVSYGFGRRVCVGRYVADNSLFINIAVMLWASKIERKKNALGQLVPLDVDGFVDEGLVVLVGLSHTLKRMLTCAVTQTSGPFRVRDLSAFSRSSFLTYTGT